MAGRMMDPKGSMCLAGLRVSLPASRAVGSPSRAAITPWATSWRMIEGASTAMKSNASITPFS